MGRDPETRCRWVPMSESVAVLVAAHGVCRHDAHASYAVQGRAGSRYPEANR